MPITAERPFYYLLCSFVLPEAHAMALTNSMASIKPFLSVSRSLKRAVDSCRCVFQSKNTHVGKCARPCLALESYSTNAKLTLSNEKSSYSKSYRTWKPGNTTVHSTMCRRSSRLHGLPHPHCLAPACESSGTAKTQVAAAVVSFTRG